MADKLVKFPHPNLDIEENLETSELFITSDIRREKIIVYHPWDKTPFWRVRYESGKSVPKCEGQYTSRAGAIEAVHVYLTNSKKSEHTKQFELFGEAAKERPVLKRKKVKNTDATELNATDS